MWTYDDQFSLLFWYLNKIPKNSTPGKVTCIWHIERVQIDTTKFEKMQIHFFYQLFHCRCRRPCLVSPVTVDFFSMHLFITYGDRLCTVILAFEFENKNL